jgi:hypothetical protein
MSLLWWLTRAPARSRRTRPGAADRQRPGGFRPAVEGLETRCLLSSSSVLPASGAVVHHLDSPATPTATHLGVSLSANPATVDALLTVTLTALDASNQLAAGYTGTVHFTSSDTAAGLPMDYTFTPADNGVHTFNLKFDTGGSQTVTATDTGTGTITGTAGVTVNNLVPTTTGLDKTSAAEGATPLTLTVNGTNFQMTSVVQWNGQALATTFVSDTQLTAVVPAADLAEEGTAAVTVANPTPGGGVSAAQTFTINDAALNVTAPAISPVEGTAFNNVVATFTDAGGAEDAAKYKTTIDWGDGTTTTGTVTAGQGGVFQVAGDHTYAEEGSFTVKVTVQDDGTTPTATGTTVTATGTATVGDAPLHMTVRPISATEGRAFTGPVATFTDAGGAEDAAKYKATIDWGDGTTTTGTVTAGQGGVFQVAGTHTYAEEGSHTVKVTVQDDGTTPTTTGTTVTATGTATVANVPLTGTGAILRVVEGSAFSTSVALFNDADPANVATDYHATINWGDGTAPDPTGVIAAVSGHGYSVTGHHRYTTAGFLNLTVQVQDGSSTPLTLHGHVEVADAPLQGVGKPVTVANGVRALNVPVATVTDAGGIGPLGTYTAWVNWGDGTSASPGTVTAVAGHLMVRGTHTFTSPGRFTVTVMVRDKGGKWVTTTSTAVVGSTSERFVAQLYKDLLHRTVDSASLATWSRLLSRGTSKAQVAKDIEKSREYLAGVVKADYHTFLHRAAEPGGLNNGVQFLAGGGTDEQFEAGLIGSPEYFQSRGGSSTGGFLAALYQDVLGQAIDPASEAVFTNDLSQGMSRAAVAQQVLTSVQAERDLVQSLYHRFLHHGPDTTSLNHYVNVLQHGGHDEDVIAGIVSTTAYAAAL